MGPLFGAERILEQHSGIARGSEWQALRFMPMTMESRLRSNRSRERDGAPIRTVTCPGFASTTVAGSHWDGTLPFRDCFARSDETLLKPETRQADSSSCHFRRRALSILLFQTGHSHGELPQRQ
jgi:hypothetical protein